MSNVKDYNAIPVTLSVSLAQAVVITQLVAKLPFEQSEELMNYLRNTLAPIIEDIKKEEEKANRDENTNKTKSGTVTAK